MRHDKLPLDASPVSISQAGLIRLAGPARAIALDVLRVKSLQTGAYVSHFKGRGMEFDESRPYQPGDDPRNIDWRVTARSTQAYTKLFREERERPVLVVADLRGNFLSARAHAWLQGRDYVSPEDIQEVAPDVLRHRLVLSFEAEADGISSDSVIEGVLDGVGVP